MLPVACQDSRAQVRHLPEPLGPAWMLPGWKEEKRGGGRGGKEPAQPVAALPRLRMLFISNLLFLLVSRQSDRVWEINFRGGKLLIIYLQPGRA